MADFAAYVKSYDDLELLKGCVASIPDGVDIYVLDGRYADFPGDTLRTPGLKQWCADQGDEIEYHTPPDDRLPWGHERYEEEPHLRWPIHEQAKYANYEILPQETWVLHLDADERLDTFDESLLDADPRLKFAPHIDSLAPRNLTVPRLYQPQHWTFWIAGVMYPREYWSRETAAQRLFELHLMSMSHQAINRRYVPERLRVHNVGEEERPPDYHERRADQLETMGRGDRAATYREKVAERRG